MVSLFHMGERKFLLFRGRWKTKVEEISLKRPLKTLFHSIFCADFKFCTWNCQFCSAKQVIKRGVVSRRNVSGTSAEQWSDVDGLSQRHFSEWRELDRLSASSRLNILYADISMYSQLRIRPEWVNWGSVRSALAEQLRYNLRSPHNSPPDPWWSNRTITESTKQYRTIYDITELIDGCLSSFSGKVIWG